MIKLNKVNFGVILLFGLTVVLANELHEAWVFLFRFEMFRLIYCKLFFTRDELKDDFFDNMSVYKSGESFDEPIDRDKRAGLKMVKVELEKDDSGSWV